MKWDDMLEWTRVYESENALQRTFAAKVVGGVLYRHHDWVDGTSVSLVFVPIK